MRRIRNCVISPIAPPTDCIWIHQGKAYYFNKGSWTLIGKKEEEEIVEEDNNYLDLDNEEDIEKLVEILDPIFVENHPPYELPKATSIKLGGVKTIKTINSYNKDTEVSSKEVNNILVDLIDQLKTAGIIENVLPIQPTLPEVTESEDKP